MNVGATSLQRSSFHLAATSALRRNLVIGDYAQVTGGGQGGVHAFCLRSQLSSLSRVLQMPICSSTAHTHAAPIGAPVMPMGTARALQGIGTSLGVLRRCLYQHAVVNLPRPKCRCLLPDQTDASALLCPRWYVVQSRHHVPLLSLCMPAMMCELYPVF